MNKVVYFVVVTLMSSTLGAQSLAVQAPLLNKSTFKITYDIHTQPQSTRFIGPEKATPLKGLYRAGLEMFFPFRKYLQLGVDLNYTLARSNKNNDQRLDVFGRASKISLQFLGLNAHIRPQIPLSFKWGDILLFTDLSLGIATTSPITFGTQPIANYTHPNDAVRLPTPFPLALEATPTIGVQVFAWRFLGLEVGYGFRSLWVFHPMVKMPKDDVPGGILVDRKEKTVWYDLTASFIHMSLSFAL